MNKETIIHRGNANSGRYRRGSGKGKGNGIANSSRQHNKVDLLGGTEKVVRILSTIMSMGLTGANFALALNKLKSKKEER